MDLRELPTDDARRHPWERARARFFCRLLREHTAADRAVRVLDIGAGDGYLAGGLLRALPSGSAVTCFDPHYSPEHLTRFAAAYGGVQFTAARPDGLFDAILLLDVIEHVQDDTALLRDATQHLLAPDGVVIVSVPAHMFLYSRHDVVLGHYRRYDAGALRAALARAGLQPRALGGLFHSLIAPRGVAKAMELLGGEHSTPPTAALAAHADTAVASWPGGTLVTELVDRALAFDNACSRLAARAHLTLPGTSLWAVAQKADA